MGLLPRLSKLFVGDLEVSHTANTALDTTEARNPWPFVLVPTLAFDAAASVFKTSATVVDIAPWPFAPLEYNQGQIDKAAVYAFPTAPVTQADDFVFDNGLRGLDLTLDVLANDGDGNLLNNVSPLLGPELVVRSIDDTGFTLGNLNISADGKSVDFVLGENAEFYFGDAFLGAEVISQSFSYTVTNLTGISTTETVTVAVSQLVRHVFLLDDEDDGGGVVPINFNPDKHDGYFVGSDDHETILGSEGSDIIEGNGGNDTIYGGSADDEINAGTGNDYIYGDDGNDQISGDEGHDEIYGGRGSDIILGGDGDDVIHGGDVGPAGGGNLDTSPDHLFGGEGDDILSGGAGIDLLFGEAGDDFLYGGADADVFGFFDGDGTDMVMDFKNWEGDQLTTSSGGLQLTGLASLTDFYSLAFYGSGIHSGSLDDGDAYNGLTVTATQVEVDGTTYSGLQISNGVESLFLNGVDELTPSDFIF
ncbi:MAG: calcium-binding protein [Alphaproteobacteria bacterium]